MIWHFMCKMSQKALQIFSFASPLLAPTGALVLMMVYYTSIYISIRPLFQILNIYAFIYCYKCHSKLLKQYQCNRCHRISWGYFWDIFGIFLGYFGDILGIFLVYFGDILEIFWGYFGDILGIFWGYFGDIFGIFWGYFGDIWRIFWGYFWDILGIFWR